MYNTSFFGSKSLGFLRKPWMKCWSETIHLATHSLWMQHIFLGQTYGRVAVVIHSTSPLKIDPVLLQYLMPMLSETPPFWYWRAVKGLPCDFKPDVSWLQDPVMCHCSISFSLNKWEDKGLLKTEIKLFFLTISQDVLYWKPWFSRTEDTKPQNPILATSQ